MNSTIAFAAASASGLMAMAVLVRRKLSLGSCSFLAGMAILSLVSLLQGYAAKATSAEDLARWHSQVLVAKTFIPGIWLTFSLVYSRGNAREFLAHWRWVLIAAFLIPTVLAIGFRSELVQVVRDSEPKPSWFLRYTAVAQFLQGTVLVGCILTLVNLEKTFRAAVGTTRWRIKFVIFGLGLVFVAWIYSHTQGLLFSRLDPDLMLVEGGALLFGCLLVSFAYLRSGFAEIHVYPSHAVLQNSVIVLVAGTYLFIVGVLAQVVAHFAGARAYQGRVLLVLIAGVVLAIVVFSNRFRQAVTTWVSRHFQRSRHDYRQVWTKLTRSVSGISDENAFCLAASRFVSETFDALSVTIWLVDETGQRLTFGGSTQHSAGEPVQSDGELALSLADLSAIRDFTTPLHLEDLSGEWVRTLRARSEGEFRHGGRPLCAPLAAGERILAICILADRVNGIPYPDDEIDLLTCIADQLGAGLLNIRLTRKVMEAKELEAFQTMSAFFVHDLKNAASSLGLTLKNLPLHFDNPEFRKDALRALGNSVGRINHFIERLTALRQKLELRREEADLNELIERALASVGPMPEIELVTEFETLPALLADREHISNVMTNLLLNARDAVAGSGRISIKTSRRDSRAVVTVADDGCGMSPEFVRESLFRPFHTTKKNGLGIGMFQSKMIVEAHGGSVIAESAPHQGTTFIVTLPLQPGP